MSQQQRTAGVIGTFITDASGNIVSHSQGLSQEVSLGDREYFLILKR